MSGDSSFEHVDAVDAKNDSFEMIGDDEMAEIERNIEESWEVLTRPDFKAVAIKEYKRLYLDAIEEQEKVSKAKEVANSLKYKEQQATWDYKKKMKEYTTVLKKMKAVSKKLGGDANLDRLLKGAVKEDMKKMIKRESREAAVAQREAKELAQKQAAEAQRKVTHKPKTLKPKIQKK